MGRKTARDFNGSDDEIYDETLTFQHFFFADLI